MSTLELASISPPVKVGRGVALSGSDLRIADLMSITRAGVPICVTADPTVRERVRAAEQCTERAVAEGQVIYGVTTGIAGMANGLVTPSQSEQLQDNMLWCHKTGVGKSLPIPDVRAAMVLRANSHLRGASGLRSELIDRLLTFVNEHVTPHVPELGSIGASGDLVPLTYITGALIGHDAGYLVDFRGLTMDAREALRRLGLQPLKLRPKEAHAMLNGTSVSTAIAAGCVHDAQCLFELALGAHALMMQGLRGAALSFERFIHRDKSHTGQITVTAWMRGWLKHSTLARPVDPTMRNPAQGALIQDRHSLRCLAQFLGPVADGISQSASQIEVEMNSTTDDPLIDAPARGIYYGGNFLAQYVGVAMDQLRYLLGLMAKQLDVQIAQLLAAEFNNGLPPSLVGNPSRTGNMGLKGLQISANSIAPLISHLGASFADRFPSHAQQFNQNINSQAFGAANLTRQSIELVRQHVAIALIFGVQAVDLRTFVMAGHHDARQMLSPASTRLYEAIRSATGTPARKERAWLHDDCDRQLDRDIAAIVDDIASPNSTILAVIADYDARDVA